MSRAKNSGRLLSMIATVSPLRTPSEASPPAILPTWSRSSFQLITTSSSPDPILIAGSSPSLSTVCSKASARFFAYSSPPGPPLA